MRDIALARLTGARVHFQHLSTAGSVDMVRAAKANGVLVTAEATPHHFTLTDAECASYDAVFKVHPPLRGENDVEAVREGLSDGTIDAIATDHAPHTSDRKDEPFDAAPPGMLGLETALPLAMSELDLDLEAVLALMSWQPAEIAGISDRHGGPIESDSAANLIVIDPNHPWTVSGESMASRSSNTPFEGREMDVRVRHTIIDGEVVVEDGEATR
jgi:dihydroorotase